LCLYDWVNLIGLFRTWLWALPIIEPCEAAIPALIALDPDAAAAFDIPMEAA